MARVRIFQRGKHYHIDIHSNQKRWKESLETKIKRVAEAKAAKRLTELNEGESSFVPQIPKISLCNALKEFMSYKEKILEETTIERYYVHCRMIIPVLGDKIVSKITSGDLENFRNGRNASATTIKRDLEFFRNFMNWSIKKGYALTNPVNEIELGKETNKIAAILSIEELDMFFNVCDNTVIRTFFMIGINTGLRKSEILSIAWKNVNFTNKSFMIFDTKNNKDEIIFMNDELSKYLESVKQDDGYVVSHPDGSKYVNIYKSIDRIAKKAGTKRLIRPHQLRHTFATILLENGVSPRTAMDLGRWKNLSQLQRYTEATDPAKRQAVETLSFALHKKGTKKEQ